MTEVIEGKGGTKRLAIFAQSVQDAFLDWLCLPETAASLDSIYASIQGGSLSGGGMLSPSRLNDMTDPFASPKVIDKHRPSGVADEVLGLDLAKCTSVCRSFRVLSSTAVPPSPVLDLTSSAGRLSALPHSDVPLSSASVEKDVSVNRSPSRTTSRDALLPSCSRSSSIVEDVALAGAIPS